MDALIFDFDGVVVDSEPIHLACFQRVIETFGVKLTEEAYYHKYLGYDDHDCIVAAARDAGAEIDEDRVGELIDVKTQLVQRMFRESIEALDGAVELISSAAGAGIPLAVCSGALRDEIELACETVGARKHFLTIVSADDVAHGKPDPRGYRLALERLRKITARNLAAGLCVVIEDSPAGIAAAHSAGLKVMAVTNSYPAEALSAADGTVSSLAEVTLESLEHLVQGV